VHHCLLIARHVVGKRRVLFQGLPHPRNISVAEYSKASLEEPEALAIARDILALQKFHNSLSRRQTQHRFPSILSANGFPKRLTSSLTN
jgi:hypothetical protein